MILVAYATKYGSSREIAEHIARRVREKGKQAEVRSTEALGDLGKPEAVILGSGLYNGAWLPDAVAFARANGAALASIPTWLFSVGPLGITVEDAEEQPAELATLRERIGPRHHVVFAGALDYSKLSRADRMTMKAAGAHEGDFRDWSAINDWTDAIIAALA